MKRRKRPVPPSLEAQLSPELRSQLAEQLAELEGVLSEFHWLCLQAEDAGADPDEAWEIAADTIEGRADVLPQVLAALAKAGVIDTIKSPGRGIRQRATTAQRSGTPATPPTRPSTRRPGKRPKGRGRPRA